MLKECLEVFKYKMEKTKGQLILHTYIPADGTYLIVGRDGQIQLCVDIVKDKKTKQIDRAVSGFDTLCFYDYNSRLLSMNKPMDPKKIIHSNNYLSFFVKKDSILSGKLTEEIIEGYYSTLKAPLENKYKKSKEASRIYQAFALEEGEVDQEQVEAKEKWIKNHIFNLKAWIPDLDLKKKDYLKIFFEGEPSEYEREGKRYFLPNIYNNNKYNVEICHVIYGIPDNNLGMNTKKPFLSIKTRKCAAPYLLNGEDVMLQKQFFDYLYNLVSEGKSHVYIDTSRMEITGCTSDQAPKYVESGYYLLLEKGKSEAEICDQDNISGYRRKLDPELRFESVLKCDYQLHPEYKTKYGRYDDRLKVGKLIDEVFFMNFLGNCYDMKLSDIKIKDEILEQCVVMSRDTMAAWVFRGNDIGMEPVLLKRVAFAMMKHCVLMGAVEKVRLQFDLKYSLESYFSRKKGENMSEVIGKMRETVKQKVNSEALMPVDNDKEYYYCVGQLAYYLLSLSKANDKNDSLLNPILNAKNDRQIKDGLMRLYKKYNYRIQMGTPRFRNLMGMVMGYDPENGEKADQQTILLGYVCENVVYKKEEKENE